MSQFTSMLRRVLSRSLTHQYIDKLLDREGIAFYKQAFTHSSHNEAVNYEIMEFLGDATLNKAIVWYLFKRFPQLSTPYGVRVLSRLKIHMVSKRSFCMLAQKLGFNEHIIASDEVKATNMSKVSEDVLESFFGTTELLVDMKLGNGLGNVVCSDIIGSVLDTIDISLEYESLYDAKTRLKELFDSLRSDLTELKYVSQRIESQHHVQTTCKVKGVYCVIGRGVAYIKADAEQQGAEAGLHYLKTMGYFKEVPKEHLEFLKYVHK